MTGQSSIGILALDLGRHLGWAKCCHFGHVTSGNEEFPLVRGDSPGATFLRFRAWLRKVVATTGVVHSAGASGQREVHVVAVERPHYRGGAATALLVGMHTVVLEEAASLGLDTLAVPPSTLKKFAIGIGNASKEQMVARARSRWPEQAVVSDDQADALWVLAWARKQLGQ